MPNTCIQVRFRLDFIMEVKLMNPDQTALFKLTCGFIIVFEIIGYVKVHKQTREQKKES